MGNGHLCLLQSERELVRLCMGWIVVLDDCSPFWLNVLIGCQIIFDGQSSSDITSRFVCTRTIVLHVEVVRASLGVFEAAACLDATAFPRAHWSCSRKCVQLLMEPWHLVARLLRALCIFHNNSPFEVLFLQAGILGNRNLTRLGIFAVGRFVDPIWESALIVCPRN